MELLKKVLDMITEQGYKVDSVSATVMAEKPKLLPHIPTITKNLAAALRLSIDKVGIGATTLEGLGFVGREEGICVHATATLKRI
jgi:2-C-methyl-D-erythritol 2,4-cyclodiphosphate synthase